jgi:hypothetical protein
MQFTTVNGYHVSRFWLGVDGSLGMNVTLKLKETANCILVSAPQQEEQSDEYLNTLNSECFTLTF